MAQQGEQLLQRPLYVFDLPEEILSTLTLKDQPTRHDATPETSPSPRSLDRPDTPDGAPAAATSCNLCGLAFPNLQEQRNHVRSDLHGYNLKQKLKGLSPVGEADFERLVGDLEESISGSDSTDTDSEDEDGQANGTRGKDTTLSALLKKQAKIADPDGEDLTTKKRKRGSGKPPLLWFSTPALPKEVSLGVYRAVFTDSEQEEELHIVDTIRKKQLPPATLSDKPATQEDTGGVPLPRTHIGPHYFLCMIGGGHFAAMVVALAPKVGKKHTGVDERQATVVAHKTFHRYTTRRKQGGSQSANDASKGAAHSAGSSLRRYNEAALTNEVRDLLSEWKPMIDSAELLFIRATGSTNRRTLFGPYEGQVLRQNDPRNRGFPFSTRRATQAELMRSFVELTRVKISRVDEVALAAAAAAAESQPSTPRAATPSKPAKSQQSKEDEAALLHTTQLTSLIRRSKAPALLSYLTTNSLSPDFHFVPENAPQHHHTPTPLHLAASLNSPVVVLALLTKAGAAPTVHNGEGKTAVELAGDRATRDVFRVARHELGEEKWDWGQAGVPAPLARSEMEERERRERAEEEAREKGRREMEMLRLRAESDAAEAERRERRVGKGRPLGVPEKTAAERREEEARGMTPEMRARLERERRARAAEERMRRLQGR